MRTNLFLITFILSGYCALAQQGTLDVVAPRGGTFGVVRFTDPASIGKKTAETITYADVEGTPFWDDHWTPAYLVLRNNTTVKLDKVKLNIFTSQVHYIDSSGTELVTDPSMVRRLILLKPKDTTKVFAAFEAFPDLTDNNKLFYYRVMNEGKYRLVELQKTIIKNSDYDPLQGKKESRFTNQDIYAIAEYRYLHPVQSLEHDRIAEELGLKPEDEKWLKDNRNKLKSEPDVVAFLNYLNAKEK
jgi:predicted RecB family nuclease